MKKTSSGVDEVKLYLQMGEEDDKDGGRGDGENDMQCGRMVKMTVSSFPANNREMGSGQEGGNGKR